VTFYHFSLRPPAIVDVHRSIGYFVRYQAMDKDNETQVTVSAHYHLPTHQNLTVCNQDIDAAGVLANLPKKVTLVTSETKLPAVSVTQTTAAEAQGKRSCHTCMIHT
jgi:hypothetical protein